MGHNHDHSSASKNLKLAFFLNLAFTIFEFIGGVYVNSVAIMSDAVHDLGDSMSLGASWYLQEKSKKGANQSFSFGYGRFSLLGALINSLVLIVGSVYVIYEAIGRLQAPETSNAFGMMIFAIVGVLVNGFAAYKMSRGKTLNERVISWHLVEDVLGWVAVLIVAIVLQFKDVPYLDPALALFITAYILWNVVKRLKETLFLFLQGVPSDISKATIEEELLAVPNVQSVHHMHIWSLDGEHHVFSTHIRLNNISDLTQMISVRKQIKEVLKKYQFQHCTVETEVEGELCEMQDV